MQTELPFSEGGRFNDWLRAINEKQKVSREEELRKLKQPKEITDFFDELNKQIEKAKERKQETKNGMFVVPDNYFDTLGDKIKEKIEDDDYDNLFKPGGIYAPNEKLKEAAQVYNRVVTKTDRAERFNDKKLRYDLVPVYPMEQIAKVFTKGAEKYAPNNWRRGMPWSEVQASLERHLALYKEGEDFDLETGLYHMAHVAVNAMFLIDYYRSNPKFDDRVKSYLVQPKIVLDIDGVVCDWAKGYQERYGVEDHSYWNGSYNIGEHLKELETDEEFWVNLPILHKPDFVPHAYVSSRSIPIEWTMKFLEKNDLPCRPVHHVAWNESKVETLKSLETEIFIDDRFENFADAERAGITSFLMDGVHNQHYSVGYKRIKDLKLKNIIR